MCVIVYLLNTSTKIWFHKINVAQSTFENITWRVANPSSSPEKRRNTRCLHITVYTHVAEAFKTCVCLVVVKICASKCTHTTRTFIHRAIHEGAPAKQRASCNTLMVFAKSSWLRALRGSAQLLRFGCTTRLEQRRRTDNHIRRIAVAITHVMM